MHVSHLLRWIQMNPLPVFLSANPNILQCQDRHDGTGYCWEQTGNHTLVQTVNFLTCSFSFEAFEGCTMCICCSAQEVELAAVRVSFWRAVFKWVSSKHPISILWPFSVNWSTKNFIFSHCSAAEGALGKHTVLSRTQQQNQDSSILYIIRTAYRKKLISGGFCAEQGDPRCFQRRRSHHDRTLWCLIALK